MKRYGLSLRFVLLLCIVCMLAFPVGASAQDTNPFLASKDNGISIDTSSDGKTVTIDLKGNTFKMSTNYIQTSGDVIIKNGSIDVKGVSDAFQVSSSGDLTLGESLTIINGNAVLFIHDGGKVTINGAVIYNNNQSKNINSEYLAACVGNNSNWGGSGSAKGTTMTILSGGIISSVKNAVAVGQNGTLIISGDNAFLKASISFDSKGKVYSYPSVYTGGNNSKVIMNAGTANGLCVAGSGASGFSSIDVHGGLVQSNTITSTDNKTTYMSFATLAHENGNHLITIDGTAVVSGCAGAATSNYLRFNSGTIKASLKYKGIFQSQSPESTSEPTPDTPGYITLSGGKFSIKPDITATNDSKASIVTINDSDSKTAISATETNNGYIKLETSYTIVSGDEDDTTWYYVVKEVKSSDMTYNGAAQNLITANEVGESGTVTYAFNESLSMPVEASFDTEIPTAKDAGKYYVFYKVEQTTTDDTTKVTIKNTNYGVKEVTIAKAAAVKVTAPTAKTLTYTGEELELIEKGSISGAQGDDKLTLLYAVGDGTYSSDIPKATNVGTYTISYKPEENPNYESVEAKSITAIIGKAAAKVTVTGNTLIYNGKEQALVTATEPTFGEVQYSIDGVEYSSIIPTAADVGTYTVSYKIESTDNYTGVAPANVSATISKLGTSSATDEDVDVAKGSAATSAVMVGDYTSSRTATTTAISLKGVQVLSVDVAITVVSMDDEKDFTITTIGEFSRTVSVDVTLDFNPNFDTSNYSSYVYSMDVTGLPEGLTVSGTLSSTDEEIQTEYHHVFTISGTPSTAGANLVDMLATITISGDAPALIATASKDISIDVTYEAPTLTGLAAAITDANITAYRGTASSTALGVTVTGSYNDGSTATLEAGAYEVAWTTSSTDVAGISLDEAGTLSVTAIAPLSVYYVPVAVTVTTGELSAQASGVVTVTVSNAAPTLGIYATVSNASGDTSYSTENIIARVGDSVDIRIYDSRNTEDTTWTGEGVLPAGLTSSDSAYSFTIIGAISLDVEPATYTYVVTASNDIGSADFTVRIIVEEIPKGEEEKQQWNVAEDTDAVIVTADASTILEMDAAELAEKLTSNSGSSSGNGEAKTAKLVLTSDVEVNEQTLSTIVEKLNDTGVQNIELDLSSVVGLTAVDLSSTKNTSITTLTIGSDNTEIKSVNVENNSVITTVNLAGSGVREVKANGSTITEINVEGCAELEELDISDTEVGGQLNLTGCGSLQTLNTGGCGNLTSIEGIEDCADSLEELDVSNNSLLELNLRGFSRLTNPKLYGQKRNNWVQMRRFSLWDFFRSLSMWIAEDEETEQTENYADKVKILSAEDSLGDPVTWTVDDDGNVEFSRTPTTFKYDFDTGLAQTEVGAPEFMAAANEMMDVTISTENPTDDITKPGESSSGGSGGCNAGLGLLALAVMAFAKRKN